jgi:diadenosine tetraphosphatase ApaH/serine/threonine PP2A family protein phosphatase
MLLPFQGQSEVVGVLRVDRIARAGPGGGLGTSSVVFEAARVLLNPGSVGQPRDGDPRASYLILEPETGTATWYRAAYDIAAVGAAMRAAGLPVHLADRLRHGL